jgi:Family of unknown function (DUF6527)
MKFSELNPKITEVDWGTEMVNEIIFDCPKCGPPHRVSIHARFNQSPKDGVWGWTATWGDGRVYDSVTITPSIRNHFHGHKPCGFHCSITKGEVLP